MKKDAAHHRIEIERLKKKLQTSLANPTPPSLLPLGPNVSDEAFEICCVLDRPYLLSTMTGANAEIYEKV